MKMLKNSSGITLIETAAALVVSTALIVAFVSLSDNFTNTADADGDGVRDGVIPAMIDRLNQAFSDTQEPAPAPAPAA